MESARAIYIQHPVLSLAGVLLQILDSSRAHSAPDFDVLRTIDPALALFKNGRLRTVANCGELVCPQNTICTFEHVHIYWIRY